MYEKKGYETFEKTGDIYGLFYEYSIKILKQGGVSTMITSNKWMRAGYGEKLRQYFVDNTNPLVLIDLGAGVFETATVDSNILILEKKQVKEFNLGAIDLTTELNIKDLYNYSKEIIYIKNLSKNSWSIGSSATYLIKGKIESIGIPLNKWGIKIYRGILTGFNEAFIINEKTKSDLVFKDINNLKILKPLLRGRDITKYSYNFSNNWLINTHNGYIDKNGNDIPNININDFPYIKEYLDKYIDQIEKRGDKGVTSYNLRSCAYLDEFLKSKIIYPDIGKLSFSYDQNSMFFNNTVYFLNTDSKYILSIINSKTIGFWYKQISSSLGTNGSRGFKIYIELLPIPKISPESQKPFIEKVDKILEITKQAGYNPKNPPEEQKILEKEIDEMVYELYGLNEEEVRMVEESL